MPDCQHIPFEKLPVLDGMPPILLEEMGAITLMNRIDSKYLTDEQTLVGILEDARADGYRALLADGTKYCSYNSLYYDTPGMQMFLDHHNRRLVRQKVRTRVYVGSGRTYLEIKRKNNHGRTKKKRTEIAPAEFGDFRTNPQACDYLAAHSRFTADSIEPTLETGFRRITLVNPAETERLTIDTCLHFKNLRTGRTVSLQNAVVIELKQDGRTASQMKEILLRHRVKPIRVSKYCIGVTLTDPAVKSNRFKPKVRRIEKQINTKILPAL
ncbi:MAG: polyphosphate polymerase domain-containing protein [Bacteroidales bacterium]|nr:polyphosphate polymerase domain-containing protein [Bacteroidales bacterium]